VALLLKQGLTARPLTFVAVAGASAAPSTRKKAASTRSTRKPAAQAKDLAAAVSMGHQTGARLEQLCNGSNALGGLHCTIYKQ
jgi:hypothetical protein